MCNIVRKRSQSTNRLVIKNPPTGRGTSCQSSKFHPVGYVWEDMIYLHSGMKIVIKQKLPKLPDCGPSKVVAGGGRCIPLTQTEVGGRCPRTSIKEAGFFELAMCVAVDMSKRLAIAWNERERTPPLKMREELVPTRNPIHYVHYPFPYVSITSVTEVTIVLVVVEA